MTVASTGRDAVYFLETKRIYLVQGRLIKKLHCEEGIWLPLS